MVRANSGFTLVELSIVLIIVGLIVSGVLVGQDLIQQARLRRVISELAEFDTTLNVFRLKYNNAFPGDMSNASQFFSGASNGNGDGVVLGVEVPYVWHHLFLAGLLQRSHTGGFADIGYSDYPAGRYAYRHVGATFGRSGNTLEVGKLGGTSNDIASNALFTPLDAKSIDQKLDDGIASRGSVFGIDADNAATVTDCSQFWSHSGTTGGNPVDYNLNFTGVSCRFHYWTK